MIAHLAYPLFAILLVGASAYGLVRALRGARVVSWLPVVAVAVWLIALLFMTLRHASGGVRLNLVPIVVDGPGSARDALMNVGVFVPLGMLLATVGMRVLTVLATALAVSLSIEVTQYLLNWGRTADVNDVITNVTGAGLGWLVVWLIYRLVYAGRRTAS